jgi:hypothetical protein
MVATWHRYWPAPASVAWCSRTLPLRARAPDPDAGAQSRGRRLEPRPRRGAPVVPARTRGGDLRPRSVRSREDLDARSWLPAPRRLLGPRFLRRTPLGERGGAGAWRAGSVQRASRHQQLRRSLLPPPPERLLDVLPDARPGLRARLDLAIVRGTSEPQAPAEPRLTAGAARAGRAAGLDARPRSPQIPHPAQPAHPR